jgi:ATP-binding cassette, subfamily B, bacterial HlyB/CyaB
VMERGQIAEVGSHDELLKNAQGIYTHLHALQHGQSERAGAKAAPAARPDNRVAA